MSKFHKCREEIEGQLSIDYLLKRIMFLEKIVELGFNEELLKDIQLDHKMNLDVVRDKRKNYDNNKNFRFEVEKTIHRSKNSH